MSKHRRVMSFLPRGMRPKSRHELPVMSHKDIADDPKKEAEQQAGPKVAHLI